MQRLSAELQLQISPCLSMHSMPNTFQSLFRWISLFLSLSVIQTTLYVLNQAWVIIHRLPTRT